VAVVIAATSVAWQAPRFTKTFASTKPADQSLQAQQRIVNDLKALVSAHALTKACLPISVPYATPVPLLALELHISPADIVVAQKPSGTYLEAADEAVYTQYQLDRHDPRRLGSHPAGFRLLARNRSWRVYQSCH
jgi:hypothetical protein